MMVLSISITNHVYNPLRYPRVYKLYKIGSIVSIHFKTIIRRGDCSNIVQTINEISVYVGLNHATFSNHYNSIIHYGEWPTMFPSGYSSCGYFSDDSNALCSSVQSMVGSETIIDSSRFFQAEPTTKVHVTRFVPPIWHLHIIGHSTQGTCGYTKCYDIKPFNKSIE